ncbi:MAG: hypothetical protein ACREU2_10530 [Steroidobacteraceae bacterium]
MNRNSFRSMSVAALAAVAFWAGSALAAPAAPAHIGGAEASIPQANVRITNWVLDRYRGIWVETAGHQWYYGTFLGPCMGIGTADTVGFRFSPDGSLNRYSEVIVPRPHHRTCAFQSFVTSAAP